MDNLYACTITGQMQLTTNQLSPKKYYALELMFPLMANLRDDIIANATAYNIQEIQAPCIVALSGAWHGYKEPRITAHSVDLIYNKDDVPENYEPRPPTVSGVGKVLLLDEKNKCVKIETASWDRTEATKKTFQLMGYYEPEVRYKNVAKAIPNAYIYFSGRLRSQEPTTSYFAIILDDTTWASPSSTQAITTAASSPTTPSKKPRLGGKRSGSEANNPASTSSTASSSKA